LLEPAAGRRLVTPSEGDRAEDRERIGAAGDDRQGALRRRDRSVQIAGLHAHAGELDEGGLGARVLGECRLEECGGRVAPSTLALEEAQLDEDRRAVRSERAGALEQLV